jgi:hypothetical protein
VFADTCSYVKLQKKYKFYLIKDNGNEERVFQGYLNLHSTDLVNVNVVTHQKSMEVRKAAEQFSFDGLRKAQGFNVIALKLMASKETCLIFLLDDDDFKKRYFEPGFKYGFGFWGKIKISPDGKNIFMYDPDYISKDVLQAVLISE